VCVGLMVRDDAAVLAEAKRVLKKNGSLYVMQSILPRQRLRYRLRRTASFLLHRRWDPLFRNPESVREKYGCYASPGPMYANSVVTDGRNHFPISHLILSLCSLWDTEDAAQRFLLET